MTDQPTNQPRTVTFSDMETYLLGEANRIDVGQRALVLAEMRKAPDSGQMRNKEICEAIHRLVGLCRTEGVSAALKRASKVSG